jgi:glutaminyl-tRNA synthetase
VLRRYAGTHAAGVHVLRARIDPASADLHLRDPVLYRVRRGVPHFRTGEHWAVYPMYDLGHCFGDYAEGVTHSLCTLEFDAHRPLYEWFMDRLGGSTHQPRPAGAVEVRPAQFEFGRLRLEGAVTSKRLLRRLVEAGVVDGWDDPRLPTLAGMRRRGYPPEALRSFCDQVGVSRADGGPVARAMLEQAARASLEALPPAEARRDFGWTAESGRG